MSIVAYVGLPGAGKSYGVVENVVLPGLRQGRTIVTNLPLQEMELRAIGAVGEIVFLPQGASGDTIAQLGLDYPGALFVIDECWRYWPSGLKANRIPEAQQEFFTMHRHRVGDDGLASEIVIVVQDLAMIATFARNLVEETFRVSKLSMIGMTRGYRVDIYQGCVSGPHPPASKRLREIFGKYRKEVYACYQSHTMSKTGAAGHETKADKRGNIFRSWKVIVAGVALVLLPVFIIAAVHSFHNLGGKKPPAVERSADRPGASSPQTKPVVAAAPPAPRESTVWRLSSVMAFGSRVVIYADSIGGPRRVDPKFCRPDESANLVCTLHGELVTFWTGVPPPTIGDALMAPVRAQVASNP